MMTTLDYRFPLASAASKPPLHGVLHLSSNSPAGFEDTVLVTQL